MRAARLLMIGASIAALGGCTPDFGTANDAPVILRVDSITGSSGGGGTTGGSGIGQVLLSDVRTDTGSVFNDNATLTVENIPKNQNGPTLGPFNDVVIEQYRVRYVRTDGLNREGVEVPYSFSGTVNILVAAGGQTTVPILIVRHAAKLEPPLTNLTGRPFGGFDLLTTFAEITLFGHTTSGKAVEATGRIEVHFADFAG
jgi:hypothetical protein